MASKSVKTVVGREPLLTIYQRREVGSVFDGNGSQGPVEAAFALIGKDLDMHDSGPEGSSYDTYDFTFGEQVFAIEVKRDLTPETKAQIEKDRARYGDYEA